MTTTLKFAITDCKYDALLLTDRTCEARIRAYSQRDEMCDINADKCKTCQHGKKYLGIDKRPVTFPKF